MKSKKSKKRIVLYVILCLIIVIVYFRITDNPAYEGRFTVDINNRTSQKIEGAILEYEAVGESVTLPTVKPYERLIVIMPKKIGDKPQRSRVFLKYNGITEEILGEFHILTGAKYDIDLAQYAKVKIKKDSLVSYPQDMYFNLKTYCEILLSSYLPANIIRTFALPNNLNLKPYFRIIDMDKEK